MVSQPIMLILVDWFIVSSIFFEGRLSSCVKIRLHTENQLPRLPGSALKVPVVGGGGGGFLPIIKSSSNSS